MRHIEDGFRLILEKYFVLFSMVYDGSTFSSNEIYDKGNQKEEKSVLFSKSYMGMKKNKKIGWDVLLIFDQQIKDW